MKQLIIYRNCFTGDVSGGDTHMSGLMSWILESKQDTQLYLVLPKNDGQQRAYPEVKRVKRLTYPDTKLRGSIALIYIARALKLTLSPVVPQTTSHHAVHIASSHFLPDVLPVFFARVPQSAKVVFIHHIIQDMGRPKSFNTTLANLQEKLCFALIRRRFGKVVVVNHQVSERLRQMGFRQHVLLSSNFVQTTAKPVPFKDKDITLAFCGRMVTQKGVDDFVAVCQALAGKLKGFRAVMIGAGPELARLRAEVKKQKLSIELVGFVDDTTKFNLLARSKLFVFPSAEEGWGIAIAEALAVGTPVVAYNLPVYKAIFGSHIHVVPHKRQKLIETVELSLKKLSKPADYTAQQQTIAAFAAQFRVDHVASAEFQFMIDSDYGKKNSAT